MSLLPDCKPRHSSRLYKPKQLDEEAHHLLQRKMQAHVELKNLVHFFLKILCKINKSHNSFLLKNSLFFVEKKMSDMEGGNEKKEEDIGAFLVHGGRGRIDEAIIPSSQDAKCYKCNGKAQLNAYNHLGCDSDWCLDCFKRTQTLEPEVVKYCEWLVGQSEVQKLENSMLSMCRDRDKHGNWMFRTGPTELTRSRTRK